MTKNNMKLRKIGFTTLFIAVTALHFLVTFVVLLFLLSTLNITNRNLLHFERLDYIEIFLAVIIIILSVRIYFRSFRKISQSIKVNFFPDLLP